MLLTGTRCDVPPSPARTAVLDALVVGGGPAGLSAALVLGRARRNVLVVDAGRPANRVSNGVGGLLGHDRVAPAQLRRSGREQLAEHPTVDVREGKVRDARASGDLIEVAIDDATVRTRTLVLAHGLTYEPPPLPGIHPLWGRSVFHCAFCDGWEVRDRPLAVHGNGPAAARSALVTAGWSGNVLLCTDGPANLGDGRAALERAGVRIREEAITRLVGDDGRLERIEFAAGPAEPRDALFVRTRRAQPNGLAEALGCELSAEETIVADAEGAPACRASSPPATRRPSTRARSRTRWARARASPTRWRSTWSRRTATRPRRGAPRARSRPRPRRSRRVR